jgi:hypothetical protein
MIELSRRLNDLADRVNRFVAGLQLAPTSNHAATTAPGVTDDEDAGYGVGSVWVDTAAGDAYLCVDATAGAAVWKQIT